MTHQQGAPSRESKSPAAASPCLVDILLVSRVLDEAMGSGLARDLVADRFQQPGESGRI